MSFNIFDLEHKQKSKRSLVIANCPFCESRGEPSPDTKYRLAYNTASNTYRCLRCGATHHNTSMKAIEAEPIVQTFPELRSRVNGLFTLKSREIDLDKFSVPVSQSTPFAYKYLSDRGVTDFEIESFRIRTGISFEEGGRTDRRWVGRIVFPFFEDGQCIFAVGRSYTDGQTLRYLNSVGPKDQVVFGIDSIQKNESVIICEGILSAIAAQRYAGVPAVATLGKYPSDAQLDKIKSRVNRIYLSYDGDVSSEEQEKVIKRCLKKGFDVRVVAIPYATVGGKIFKDPDDWKHKYTEFFSEATKVNLVNFQDIAASLFSK